VLEISLDGTTSRGRRGARPMLDNAGGLQVEYPR